MRFLWAVIHILLGCTWQEKNGQFGRERHCVHCGRVEYEIRMGKYWNYRRRWSRELPYDYLRAMLEMHKEKKARGE